MDAQMLTTLGILAGAIALLSWGRPRADVVAILVVLALLLSHVLTPQESFAGFGDPVVILIAGVFIVGAGLENTGMVHRVSAALVKVGGTNEGRLIVRSSQCRPPERVERARLVASGSDSALK